MISKEEPVARQLWNNFAAEPSLPRPWSVLDAGALYSVPARRPKGSLTQAALTCRSRLSALAKSENPLKPVELISVYNNAALLFYHNARFDCARRITLDAMQLCSAGWKTTGDIIWGACLLQPYVNLGRLASARNDFGTALGIYRNLYDYVWKGTPFHIGDNWFTPDLLEQFRDLRNEELNLASFSVAVYLADGGRAFLGCENFEGLSDFTTDLASDLGIIPAGADSAVFQPASGASTGAQLGTDEKAAAFLVISELRARAFARMGKENKALAIYSALVKCLPRLRPGMVSVYASVSEILLRKSKKEDAQRLLEYGSQLLKTFPSTPNLELEQYQGYFALGAQFDSLGNVPGATRCAEAALEYARSRDHQVGIMRALVLLLTQYRSASPSHISSSFNQNRNDCFRTIDSCFYPLERACALLEIVNGLSDLMDTSKMLQQSRQILRGVTEHGGRIPPVLDTMAGHGECWLKNEPECVVFTNPELEELYLCLRDMACESGDKFELAENDEAP